VVSSVSSRSSATVLDERRGIMAATPHALRRSPRAVRRPRFTLVALSRPDCPRAVRRVRRSPGTCPARRSTPRIRIRTRAPLRGETAVGAHHVALDPGGRVVHTVDGCRDRPGGAGRHGDRHGALARAARPSRSAEPLARDRRTSTASCGVGTRSSAQIRSPDLRSGSASGVSFAAKQRERVGPAREIRAGPTDGRLTARLALEAGVRDGLDDVALGGDEQRDRGH
jgi:hypothetical protein